MGWVQTNNSLWEGEDFNIKLSEGVVGGGGGGDFKTF